MKKQKLLITLITFISIIFSQEIYEGYTLFTPYPLEEMDFATTYLIDNDEEVIHSWIHERGPASMPYLLPDSSIIYPYRVNDPTMPGGGAGGGIQKISWDGTILWEYIISDVDYQQHHDIQPMPNGNILVIAWERKTAQEAYDMGRLVIDNPLYEFWSASILEIQPVGTDNANIVWEWHVWDHLIQNIDQGLPNFGVISEHPELLDINKGTVGDSGGASGPTAVWMHLNSIDYNEELDQIAFCSKKMGEIYIIDHSTTTAEAAGHSGGNSGFGGDLLYRWGNPQIYDRGNFSDQMLIGPHSINWIAADYPGEGHLILFNNGNIFNQLSTVIEFIPPLTETNNYLIEDDQPYGPEIPHWEFSDDFFSALQSGAFRLENGNTLITNTQTKRIFEVTLDGIIVWDYIFNGDALNIARAQKYGLNYLGSDDFTPGDVNDDDFIDILDIVGLVSIVLDFSEPVPAADLNDDGTIDILDAIILVEMIMFTNID